MKIHQQQLKLVRYPNSDPVHTFSISLVGRPNVGKSSLFNRLISSHKLSKQVGQPMINFDPKNILDHVVNDTNLFPTQRFDPLDYTNIMLSRSESCINPDLQWKNQTLTPLPPPTTAGGRFHKAMVFDIPGVTRDRKHSLVEVPFITSRGFSSSGDLFGPWGHPFSIIDTPGVDGEDMKFANMNLEARRKHFSQSSSQFLDENIYSTSTKSKMLNQVDRALDESTCAFFVIDGQEGIQQTDREIARWLHRRNINSNSPVFKSVPPFVHPTPSLPIILLITKCEDFNLEEYQIGLEDKDNFKPDPWGKYGDKKKKIYETMHSADSLGFGLSIPISNPQGSGFDSVAEAIRPFHLLWQSRLFVQMLDPSNPAFKEFPGNISSKNPETDDPPKTLIKYEPPPPLDLDSLQANSSKNLNSLQKMENAAPSNMINISVIGRPNVGKSSIINSLLGDDRLVTGATPGVTRDSIATKWEWNGFNISLVDTAGIRPRAAIDSIVEKSMVEDSFAMIHRSHVVVLVMDISQGHMTRQELRLAKFALEQGRPIVFLVNKSDLLIQKWWDMNPESQIKMMTRRKNEDEGDSQRLLDRADRPILLDVFGGSTTKNPDFGITTHPMQHASMFPSVASIAKNVPESKTPGRQILGSEKRYLAEVLWRIQVRLNKSLPQVSGAHLVHTSAHRDNPKSLVKNVMSAVVDTFERWQANISTKQLSDWLQYITKTHKPPKSVTVNFMVQTNTRPPTFVVYVSIGPAFRRKIMRDPNSPWKEREEKLQGPLHQKHRKRPFDSHSANPKTRAKILSQERPGTKPLPLSPKTKIKSSDSAIDVTRFLDDYLTFLRNNLRSEFGLFGTPIRLFARSRG